MRIVYHLENEKEIDKGQLLNGQIFVEEIKEEAGFLLTNKLGGYLWLTSQPLSRYQGWFFTPRELVGQKIFKIIENIEVVGFPAVSKICSNFWSVERKRNSLKESFFLPSGFNSLVYEISPEAVVELTLDIKESYDNREEGRNYEIFEERNLTVVKYNQPGLDFPLFLAIKAANGKIEKLNQWITRRYVFDQQRNSPPFERYVFKAVRIKAPKIVFSASVNKNQAVEEAESVFENSENLKIQEKDSFKEKFKNKFLKKSFKEKEIFLAYLCARNSLRSFVICQSSSIGLSAGLPWFFQFWPRDEAVSLKALMDLDEKKAKDIFFKQIKLLSQGDELKNPIDAIGWLFKRAADFIKEKKFNSQELKEIKTCLEKTIEELLKHHLRDGLVINQSRETWMDSLERSGARIEIQALTLNLYKLAAQLNGFLGRKRRFYSKLEKELKMKVREKFWNGKTLADGFNPESGRADFTIRPNIFLAAYTYPDLLNKREWVRCFENVLPKLWLGWGGVATIDKEHPSFHCQYTGEIPGSYHQGDSWFYLNNLAALVLDRTDRRKFRDYIGKIFEASTEETLWRGIIGYHSELSSAQSFQSQGCLAQSWSAALFIELFTVLNK